MTRINVSLSGALTSSPVTGLMMCAHSLVQALSHSPTNNNSVHCSETQKNGIHCIYHSPLTDVWTDIP